MELLRELERGTLLRPTMKFFPPTSDREPFPDYATGYSLSRVPHLISMRSLNRSFFLSLALSLNRSLSLLLSLQQRCCGHVACLWIRCQTTTSSPLQNSLQTRTGEDVHKTDTCGTRRFTLLCWIYVQAIVSLCNRLCRCWPPPVPIRTSNKIPSTRC